MLSAIQKRIQQAPPTPSPPPTWACNRQWFPYTVPVYSSKSIFTPAEKFEKKSIYKPIRTICHGSRNRNSSILHFLNLTKYPGWKNDFKNLGKMVCLHNMCHIFHLKGQCHEIFCFWFFLWISFPPAPEYPISTVSNFFENSRRYSQVKVHHRCQWHRWQIAAGINDTGGKFCHHFPLCCWHRWQICHRCQRYRRQICRRCQRRRW